MISGHCFYSVSTTPNQRCFATLNMTERTLDMFLRSFANQREEFFAMSVHLVADGVLCQRKTNRFTPTAATPGNRVTSSCIRHRVKPPAFFGREPLPVTKRGWNQ